MKKVKGAKEMKEKPKEKAEKKHELMEGKKSCEDQGMRKMKEYKNMKK